MQIIRAFPIVILLLLVLAQPFKVVSLDQINTLERVIRHVKGEVNSLVAPKCTREKCCICGKTFKNSTYSALHIAIHHSFQEEGLSTLFDTTIPQSQRYQFCKEYLSGRLKSGLVQKVCVGVIEDVFAENLFLDISHYVLLAIGSIMGILFYNGYFQM